MSIMDRKKIVYLFGAGATHAEIINISDDPNTLYRDRNGLLILNVSKRVMKVARRTAWFKKKEDVYVSSQGSLNIELLISLFENNKIEEKYISKLKVLVEKDIKKILTNEIIEKFYLHKGLIELHEFIKNKEKLLGFISLNYDNVLDSAYEEIHQKKPDYYLTTKTGRNLPLLKLHGSFTWENIKVYNQIRTISILPIGINKNYLFPPYNFIWGKAYELLVECDILRIIGCSLNQGDLGLIDILFKAHKERDKQIKIEIIDFQPENSFHPIKNSYGFFPGLVEPKDIEGTLIADPLIANKDSGNPFKIWLRAKAEKMLKDNINNTRFLKKCLD